MYFAYIDGLRAVSILGVILYHLNANMIPGGFAGVDMFFVISGFIVTASLHEIRFGNPFEFIIFFYQRRFKRILPALVLMLTVTTLLTVLFIPKAWLSSSIPNVAIAAYFGFSNVVLGRGIDYFSPQGEFNPFTHTWSLAVEEQFYLVFPILFYLSRTKKWQGPALLAVISAASLGYAFNQSGANASQNFYSGLARFWELGAGVLLYSYLRQTCRFDAVVAERHWASYCGAALVIASLALSAPTSFPFPGAILPVIGVALLIFSLQGTRPTSAVGRLLASKPLTSVGRLSYSLYLWHWPVFVLFRWTVGFSTFWQRVSALALAIACALLSYNFVERPFRTAVLFSRPWLAIPAYLALMLVGAALAIGMVERYPDLSLSVVAANRADWDPSASPSFKTADGCEIVTGRYPLEQGYALSFSPAECPRRDSAKIYVIGDSHALAYEIMLKAYAAKHSADVLLYAIPSCSFLDLNLSPPTETCRQMVRFAIDDMRSRLKAGDVVFAPALRIPRFRDQWSSRQYSTQWAADYYGQHKEELVTEAVATLSGLAHDGVHFIFELPKPIFKTPAFRCNDWFNNSNAICEDGQLSDRAALLKYREHVVDFAETMRRRMPFFNIWDPFFVLCPNEQCSTFDGAKPLMFDGDHISAYANTKLFPSFDHAVEQVAHQ